MLPKSNNLVMGDTDANVSILPILAVLMAISSTKVRRDNSDAGATRTKSRIIQFRSVLDDSEQKRSTPVCKLIILLHVDDNSCCHSRIITSKKTLIFLHN